MATDDEKKAAEQVARGIEGVQAVRNELQMVPGSAKKVVEAKDDEIPKWARRLVYEATTRRILMRIR